MPLFVKAYDLSLALHQDSLAVDSAHMAAIAEPNPQKQLEWNLKAMAVAENSKDPKARDWLGSLYNNIGWIYHDLGNYEAGLDLFKKALIFREDKGEAETIRIAKWCIARTYRSLKKYDEALKAQISLKIEFEKSSEKSGYVFEELGELYLVMSQPELAKNYFALAYSELSRDDWFKAYEASRLQKIKELGGIE